MKLIPSASGLLEAAEKTKRLHDLIVWIWGYVPFRIQNRMLRLLNPRLSLGALAVIIDPYSHPTDPKVLLGWHPYKLRQGAPWALLGGALKAGHRELADPAEAVKREIKEETRLDIEVVKLLAIDTDLDAGTMDFYFECALCHGYPDLDAALPTSEVTKLRWFRISGLPGDVWLSHRRFLADVLPRIPRVPGVSWIVEQRPPPWWDRLAKAQSHRRQLLCLAAAPGGILTALVEAARGVLTCESMGLFVTKPPIQIVSPDFSLPADIKGNLCLLTESNERYGTRLNPGHVERPLSRPEGEKLGLTVGLLRAQPLGRAVRLHDDWLHHHPDVRSWTGHDHLLDRTCHSLAAVSVVGQNKVLGLLKAENKRQYDPVVGSDKFVPFTPDDGYILEEFAAAAAPWLERLAPDTVSEEG